MANVIEPIARLAAQLGRLPGVGAKTAMRLAYHLLGVPEEQALELARAIESARREVHTCPICGGYTDVTPCALCADSKRESAVICVVRDARDIAAMEKSREFRGRYHVLGGLISPLDGVGPEDIRIEPLMERIRTGGVEEVILATSLDIEGEATAGYIARLVKAEGVAVSRIAHGIPIGGSLEYTDEVTLARALEGRRSM